MKKSAIISFLLFTVFAFGQGIQFENSDFKTIIAKAKKENKLIFLDAYTDWCAPCKMMVKNIFPLKAVGDYYNANFINAKIDMEKGEGIELAKKFGVKVYPSYLFINGDGEAVHRTVGYVQEKDFLQFGVDALDPNTSLSSLKQKFEKGEKDPEFLKNLAGLTLYSDIGYTGKVLEKYFEVKKSEIDKGDVNLLLSGLQNQTTENPIYKIFVSKKEEITKIFPLEQYNKFDDNIKISTILKKAYNKETKVWDNNYFLAEVQKEANKTPAEAQLILSKIKASYALRDKDFATYEKLMLELYKDYSAASSSELNSIAWNFFENVNTKSSLETAIKWAQESVKKDENYANSDTLANLFNKIGDKKNAKITAAKSIELAKKSGEDYADTEKLLNSL